MSPTVDRAQSLSLALKLETVTIVWMIVEAGSSIAVGALAKSALLVVFGIDSVIELVSSIVLFRRLVSEIRGVGFSDSIEARAARISGWLLYLLAASVVITSAWKLVAGQGSGESFLGIAIALVAAVAMPPLARAKLRLADTIGSKALRADATETLTCGRMSQFVAIGLILNASLHWWWIDSVETLLLIPYLIREGKEALAGGCTCDSG